MNIFDIVEDIYLLQQSHSLITNITSFYNFCRYGGLDSVGYFLFPCKFNRIDRWDKAREVCLLGGENAVVSAVSEAEDWCLSYYK